MILSHIIIFLILLLCALVYQRLAIKFNITDIPNHRSSHQHVTVRGGGILFPVAIIFWWMVYDFQNTWMVLGIVWISAISLLDDIYSLSSKFRMGVQFLALSMAFHDLDLFQQVDWYFLPLIYFVGLGVINSVNFMDGINGITGLYGLVFFGSLLAVNAFMPIFDRELLQYEILALCVFLLFNFRKKAIMFAGDIGSISLAYLMIYFMGKWFLYSGSWTVILMVLVYGADSFTTLAERIKNKEKVFEPHRKHLYQLLANEGKMDHVIIAIIYALIQMAINFFAFIQPQGMPDPYLALSIMLGLGFVYIVIKVIVVRKYKTA
ncbi:glycosyltransferase family 4 protein [Algoriphagus sp. SE2]|uniref:MraY family glycosyltransferase n=1 Tax=Algoriphagus sp. SE2 TaxID=3141536 RepID=UPI0031CD5104